MRILIEDAICTGHGRCYNVAADLFEPGDDGRGILLHAEVPTHLENSARLAAASCPESAIRIEP